MNALNDALAVARVTLPELLAQRDQRLRIPYYQRKYAWTRENCEVFLEDILEAGERGRTHFFSNVTLSPLDAGSGHYVVDGQQRLTTCSLFLEALRRVFADEGGLALPLAEYLLIGGMPKLSFEDQVDQRTYRHLLLGHFCDRESVSKPMSDNFEFFREKVQENRERLRPFLAGGLLERLLFVRVILPAKMSPQRVFERMNATKLPVEQFDLVKNFLLMEAGHDSQAVYNLLEEKLRAPESSYWQARVQALVSMHARELVPGHRIYKAFRRFFEQNPLGETRALPFLQRMEEWMRGFAEARMVFEHQGLFLDETRVYLSDGYAALLMKLAVVYSSPKDVPRRNELIARIVDSIRSYIAVKRLGQARKMHPRRDDADWTYQCLRASGDGYEQSTLADAIEKTDVFGVHSRDQVDAAIRRWVNEKLEQQGYVNNARSIGIAGRPMDSAEDAIQRYHDLFAKKKEELPIVDH